MLAAATPLGSMNETTDPGAIPCCARKAPSSAPIRARSPYVRTASGSGAMTQGASGRAAACASIASRNVRIVPRAALSAGAASGFACVLAQISAEQGFLGRFARELGCERPHHPRDVEEVPVIQVVRNAVAAPGSAAHRQ